MITVPLCQRQQAKDLSQGMSPLPDYEDKQAYPAYSTIPSDLSFARRPKEWTYVRLRCKEQLSTRVCGYLNVGETLTDFQPRHFGSFSGLTFRTGV